MTLHIVSAATASQLALELVQRVAQPHDDPFGRDVIVVPSAGMREYLVETLTRSLPGGTAAGPILGNVDFIFPNAFNLRVLGHQRVENDPWSQDRLRWTILSALQREPDLLPGFAEGRRKLARAEKAARLFEKYAAQRPSMLADWAEGRLTDGFSTLDESRVDGYGWQYQVWRRVRDLVGTSPAEEVVQRTPAVEPRVRYWLFALEFLSPAKISLLAGLGADAPIGLYLLQAPDAKPNHIDNAVVSGRAVARHSFGPAVFDHPLNRSWGQIAHETTALVGAFARHVGTPVQRLHHPERFSLLGRLHDGIVGDHAVAVDGAADRSVQVHLCHGATRQVQVLRDALLHLFESDPTLTPRDVMVLCTDLEAFAPLIGPIFAAGNVPVPVTIVDRSITSRTQVESAVDALLTALQGRCTVSELLDVLAQPYVQASVGLTADDVTLVEELLPSLDVRWGLNAAHRARWGYPTDDDISTWRHAVDRMLLGALVQDAAGVEVVRGITPLTDVDGQSALAVGRFSMLLARLEVIEEMARGAASLADWAAVLHRLAATLLLLPGSERSLLTPIHQLAQDLDAAAQQHPHVVLSFPEFCDTVRATMDGMAMRSRQWSDSVRVATPERFRGVPSRVIALLGMDEERLGTGGVDGDDLLAVTAHVGDRDRRGEARLGLLTTICAASDALVVLADGHSVTDNTEIPPAMPVRELIDHLADLCGLAPDDDLPFVVHHSRQATDVVNLGVHTGEGRKNVTGFVDRPWSFDPGLIDIAERVIASANAPAAATHIVPLAPPADDEVTNEITIAELARAMSRPAETYLRDRLRIALPAGDDDTDEALELWPTGLGLFKIGDEMLTARVEGAAVDEWAITRRLDGGVPPRRLGDLLLDEVAGEVDAMIGGITVDVALRASRSVEVAIDGFDCVVRDVVTTYGDTVLSFRFSKWGQYMRVGPLLTIAALTVDDPDTVWTARVVARADGGDTPTAAVEVFTIAGDSADERDEHAMAVLAHAARMRQRSLRAPVPVFERASWLLGYHTMTATKKALGDDLRRESLRWAVPSMPTDSSTAYSWLSTLESGELEADLPDDDDAARRYARALREMWADHVAVAETPEVPPKSARTAPAAAKKAGGRAKKEAAE